MNIVPEEYWAEFLASATRKRHAVVKFRQRILPRWYKLIRGGVWHIGALSYRNAMNARKHGWRVSGLRGMNYLIGEQHKTPNLVGDLECEWRME